MKISSPAQEQSNESLSGNRVENTADRRRSVTSGPIGKSTGKTNHGVSATTGKESRTVGKPSPELIDVAGAVEKLNKIVQSQRTNVSFSVDEGANATVIKVFKTETGELIKQFPPEEILAMKEKINKSIGWLYDNKV